MKLMPTPGFLPPGYSLLSCVSLWVLPPGEILKSGVGNLYMAACDSQQNLLSSPCSPAPDWVNFPRVFFSGAVFFSQTPVKSLKVWMGGVLLLRALPMRSAGEEGGALLPAVRHGGGRALPRRREGRHGDRPPEDLPLFLPTCPFDSLPHVVYG